MDTDDTWDVLILVGIVIVMVAFGTAVIDTTYQYDEERAALAQDRGLRLTRDSEGPEIPECDKELWDRIREGCDDAIED